MVTIKFNELLPEVSFAYLPATGEIVKIKKGENGYYPMPNLDGKYTVDEMNEAFDVTKPQAEAMYHASVYGWHIPASNPKMWDEKEKEMGEKIYTHNDKKLNE